MDVPGENQSPEAMEWEPHATLSECDSYLVCCEVSGNSGLHAAGAHWRMVSFERNVIAV